MRRKLNVREAFRRRLRLLSNVFCTSHLLHVSSGYFEASQISHVAVSLLFQLDIFGFKLTIALPFSFNFAVIWRIFNGHHSGVGGRRNSMCYWGLFGPPSYGGSYKITVVSLSVYPFVSVISVFFSKVGH